MTKALVSSLCLLSLVACSSPPNGNRDLGSRYDADKTALEAATREGTSAALDRFIATHPDSDWMKVAIYRRDEAAFQEAKALGTKEAFAEFLRRYPQSDWAEQARYFLQYGVSEKKG